MNSLHEIAVHLQNCRSVLVTAHIMPDGDAIGSTLGLGLALQKLGLTVTMFSVDSVPARYHFLQGVEQIVIGALPAASFDCVLVLDCGDHFRLRPIWDNIKDNFIINIDHHPTNPLFGHLNYVDHQASATGELVFGLLDELGCELDHAIAEALYVAISTDTGSFKFESTTAQTHAIAGKLVSAGVNPGSITPVLFDLRTPAAIFILRQALCSLTFSADGKIASLALTEDDMQKSHAKDEDLDGVVNYAKNIQGVEVGLIFREKADGTVKVGFRSHRVDVSKIASSFGGGGHVRAAGCSLSHSLQETMQIVLAAVRQELPV
ncbi:MAG: bifunctional oligoribonuclease/PAP phosphatase NrnA [Firmicutes bacterium]|nr:bifunctional oligoribonuclease/PAP phosphatase NrnA [Bacillota bacterium]